MEGACDRGAYAGPFATITDRKKILGLGENDVNAEVTCETMARVDHSGS